MKVGLLGVCVFAYVQAFAQNDLKPAENRAIPAPDMADAVADPSLKDKTDTLSDIETRPHVAIEDEVVVDRIGREGNLWPNISYLKGSYLMQTSFNGLGFRPRGYDASQRTVYVNGALMNDVASGNAPYRLWAGLNGIFENRRLTPGLMAAEKGFGGIGGSMSFNIRAASLKKAGRISYSLANYDSRNRLMLSYSTGRLSNGWALAAAFSKRWAKEGYISGTFFDSYAYYFALSRKLGPKHHLHFTSFGSSVKQGMAASTTLEAMDLTGTHYYNPNWGYQEGVQRNARVANSFQPLFLLNYEWNPDTDTRLDVVAGFQTGNSGRSGLDWYNAEDPRPDYYRNLPSYYLYNSNGAADSETAFAIREEWLHNPDKAQINWSRIYEVNDLNRDSVNGAYGKRSLYVLGTDRNDSKKYSIDIHFQKRSGELQFSSGLNLSGEQVERYRKMLDLLGGDYFVDLNQFAERTYAGNNSLNQQDLNHPNRIVKNGDKYNYHYLAHFLRAQSFSQILFISKHTAFFLGAGLAWNAFNREGLYKNGLFPDNSYGKSRTRQFLNYSGKAGFQYLLHAGHILFVNGAFGTRAPVFDAVFYAPRNRNATISDPENERFVAAEGGYLFHKNFCQVQIVLFSTDMKDKTEVLRYYDESYRNFVNYAMQGIDIRHMGAEFAFQIKLFHSLVVGAEASWMQVFYTSRPDITVYPDNDTSSGTGKDKVYWKNYYAGSFPQSAYRFQLKYTPLRYGFINAGINYLHRAYVSLNPARLTENAVGMVPSGSEQWHDILDQEQLPAMFTVDLRMGKSFDLKKIFRNSANPMFLHLDAGVDNVLNNKNIRIAGYQQLRFDYSSRRPERFANKYRYGYGRTFYLNVSLQF